MKRSCACCFREHKALLCNDCTSNQLGSMLVLKNVWTANRKPEWNQSFKWDPPLSIAWDFAWKERKNIFLRIWRWVACLAAIKDGDRVNLVKSLASAAATRRSSYVQVTALHIEIMLSITAFTYTEICSIMPSVFPLPFYSRFKGKSKLSRKQQNFSYAIVPLCCSVEIEYPLTLPKWHHTFLWVRETGRGDVLQSLSILPKRLLREWIFSKTHFYHSFDTAVCLNILSHGVTGIYLWGTQIECLKPVMGYLLALYIYFFRIP